MKPNLTEAEKAFLRHILAKCGNGYKTRDEALYLTKDNYSWFAAADLINETYNKNQVGGFMSSLNEKRIIWPPDEGDLWTVSDEGVEYALANLWN